MNYAILKGYNLSKYGGPHIDFSMYINSAVIWGKTDRLLMVGKARTCTGSNQLQVNKKHAFERLWGNLLNEMIEWLEILYAYVCVCLCVRLFDFGYGDQWRHGTLHNVKHND